MKRSVELTRKILPILGLGRLPNWHATRAVLIPLDYIKHIFTDFEELEGDRAYADDKAIVGALRA